jgi:hypothetical protein
MVPFRPIPPRHASLRKYTLGSLVLVRFFIDFDLLFRLSKREPALNSFLNSFESNQYIGSRI